MDFEYPEVQRKAEENKTLNDEKYKLTEAIYAIHDLKKNNENKNLYVVLRGGDEWEDIQILDDHAKVIEHTIKYPKIRAEVFEKNKEGLFVPTYLYYQNGTM